MKVIIDLTSAPFLESILIISFPDFDIDLHNDFDCVSMLIMSNELKFTFLNKENFSIELVLTNPEIVKQEMYFNFNGPLTLDNFYKGRIDSQNGLQDFDSLGRYCFYVHFCEQVYFEILAEKVIISSLE